MQEVSFTGDAGIGVPPIDTRRSLSEKALWEVVVRICSKVCGCVLLTIMMCAGNVYGQAPNTLMYQGKLTDANLDPIVGPVAVTFRIYDAEVEGVVLWSEFHEALTPHQTGVFTVELGALESFGPGVFDGSLRYLGIQVGEDEEMTPRQPITSTPYSLTSNTPGAAYRFLGGSSFGTDVTAADSIKVNVPGSGYLLLEATAWARMISDIMATSSYYGYRVSISADETTLDPESSVSYWWHLTMPGMWSHYETLSVRKFCPVTAGEYTFYLLAQGDDDDFDYFLNNVAFTAVYIPAWIGTDPPPVLSETSSPQGTQ